MYRTTTPKRLLQNVVVEYEKFEDIKLVSTISSESVDESLLVVIRREG
jgi:hypothetical protein